MRNGASPGAIVATLLTGSGGPVFRRNSARNHFGITAMQPFERDSFHYGIGPSQLARSWYSDLSLYHKYIPRHAANLPRLTHI